MSMELTVLVDNNTLIDRYLLAEPGLSLLVEDEGTRVLFDTGYSGVFLANARRMGIDLSELDYVALSHSHEDHTWGLEPLARYYADLQWEKRPLRRPALVAHPKAFLSVSDETFIEGGPMMSEAKLARHFALKVGTGPQWLTSRLVYLGEIPRRNDFEGRLTFGRKEGETARDRVPEDSALAYRAPEGLVIITGCAHAGVCNTIDYAREVCSETRILDVIGGFHLQKPSRKQLEGTLAYFERLQPRVLHACHCTDLHAKIALSRVARLEEVGVGLRLAFH
ncbi:MAG TPA: MBL fold metallo-hydrolase [Holophaga sp.]|nr:MBL fold metallo-hydrolase [Holophaga sp.]